MPDPKTSSPSSPLRAITDRGGYDYLLSLPDRYAPDAAESWPLLLFLHGTAPRGSNVWDLIQQGPTRLLAAPPDLTPAEAAVAANLHEQFIVVAPQCPHYEVWSDSRVLSLLEEILRELRPDPRRVYLTGLSMGGFGAWSVAMRFPQHFAALVPVCGGGRIADVTASSRLRPGAFDSLAVWAFHGARDPVVPLEESQRMLDALKQARVREAKLTVYPEAFHDAWTETYANPELYAWLLRQRR